MPAIVPVILHSSIGHAPVIPQTTSIEPTDRSMPPDMITKVIPTAIIP